MFRGLARRNDANDAATIALTVADEEKMSSATHAKHEKTLLLIRGVRLIVELNGELVVEDRLGFLEGDAMLLEVRDGLGRVPVKNGSSVHCMDKRRFCKGLTSR